MLYLHDVWVNFIDGQTKGFDIPEFHEWRRTDTVELLDQAPLLYVESEFYDFVINGEFDLPKELLTAVKNKAYIRKNHDRIKIPYAAVLTDGVRVMVFDTAGAEYPVKKSKLIPRQYQLVLEMIEGTSQTKFEIPEVKAYAWDSVAGLITDIEDIHMIGLTRREREMKQILMVSLGHLALSDNLREVRYWYTELFPGSMIDITTEDWSIEKMVLDMHDHLIEDWDEQHVEFGHKLTRYTNIRTDDWKELHEARVTKVDRTANR